MKAKLKALYGHFQDDSLFRNSFYLMAATGTMAGFGFVFWMMVARTYSPEQVGIASTLISAMNFISYVALLGFNSTFVHFLPKSRNRNSQVNTGLILVGVAAVLVTTLYALVAPLLAPKLGVLHTQWYFFVGYVVLVTGSAVNLATDSIFIAFRAAKYNFLVDGLVASITQVSLPLALVAFGSFGIFASQGAGVTLAMCVSIFLLIKKFGYRPKVIIDKKVLSELFHFSAGNYIANLFNILPTMVLPFVVLNKLGPEAAGYYYLSFMMATLLFTVAYAVSQSLFAEGSYGEIRLRSLVKRSVLILSAIMIPASVFLGAVGPYILKLFGKGYSSNSQQLMMVLAASGIFVAAFVLGGVLLRITKQITQLIIANIFYAVSITVIALVFTGRGLAWAGVAWAAGHALTAGLMFVFLYVWQRRRIRAVQVPQLADEPNKFYR